jgi:hypothetical protein
VSGQSKICRCPACQLLPEPTAAAAAEGGLFAARPGNEEPTLSRTFGNLLGPVGFLRSAYFFFFLFLFVFFLQLPFFLEEHQSRRGGKRGGGRHIKKVGVCGRRARARVWTRLRRRQIPNPQSHFFFLNFFFFYLSCLALDLFALCLHPLFSS